MRDEDDSLASHLEALRKSLIRCVWGTVLLFPIGYWISPFVIEMLVRHCFPEGAGTLHYFAPMEVFWVQLQLSLVLALAMAFPWNAVQIWRFLLPALYPAERKTLVWWVVLASGLFFLGAYFCIGFILPLLMRFSLGFATEAIQPMLGVAKFVELSGWLILSFGVMFQMPIAVLVAVRFGWITTERLRKMRPYVMTVLLVIAAILTPPDVVSQVMLALPTWILFEVGLLLARRMEKQFKTKGEER